MIHDLVTAIGLAFFLFGLFVFISAVIGLFRFDYVLNRMHAAAVGDSLGIFCVLIGLMLLHGWSLAMGKTLLIFVFLWLASPVAGMCHNVGQLLAAAGVMRTWAVLAYLPYLVIAGVVAGLFTGVAAQVLDGRLEKLRK